MYDGTAHQKSALRFILLILFLKECNVSDCQTSGFNFDHNTGPRYLVLCLPKFTVFNLGIEKSTFLRAYPEVFIKIGVHEMTILYD